jgi:hypothetical protein
MTFESELLIDFENCQHDGDSLKWVWLNDLDVLLDKEDSIRFGLSFWSWSSIWLRIDTTMYNGEYYGENGWVNVDVLLEDWPLKQPLIRHRDFSSETTVRWILVFSERWVDPDVLMNVQEWMICLGLWIRSWFYFGASLPKVSGWFVNVNLVSHEESRVSFGTRVGTAIEMKFSVTIIKERASFFNVIKWRITLGLGLRLVPISADIGFSFLLSVLQSVKNTLVFPMN